MADNLDNEVAVNTINQNNSNKSESNDNLVLHTFLLFIGLFVIVSSILLLLITFKAFPNIDLIGILSLIIGLLGIIVALILYRGRISGKIKILDKKISLILLFFLISIILFGLTGAFSVLYATTQIKPENGLIVCIFPNGDVKKIPYYTITSEELNTLFPQISSIPFSHTQTYATNGQITSLFHNGDSTLERRRQYTEITFRNFCDTDICNSGWMIGPLMGYNASQFSSLSFYTRGAEGNENYGLKLKDTKGNEFSVNILEYAENHRIGTKWQKISIPLDHFVKIASIDRSSLDIISLYTDGIMSYRDPETIDVADFQFE